jgi:FLVCR family feline leukemia virus subgroup C receptor-related protein
VGAAQPFFQCTPPLLSATWFGTKERSLATAVAINFNQVTTA